MKKDDRVTGAGDDGTAGEAAAHAARVTRHRVLPWLSGAARWALAIAVLLLVLLLALWSQRKQIAGGFIDRSLRDRGVASRYRIADLGFSRQRLVDVVIGDPQRPDLVADWVEVTTQVGLAGARVTGLRAGSVRVRGRLADGRLNLGALDRLLPGSSGPFQLPAIDVDVIDGRMRLETPAGVVGVKLAGRGRLNDGFVGRAALIADRLELGDCRVERVAATLSVSVTETQPHLRGPIRASRGGCAGVMIDGASAVVDTLFNHRLDRWRGDARLAVAGIAHPEVGARSLTGTIDFDGSARKTTGTIDVHSASFRTSVASGGTAHIDGRYRLGGGIVSIDGNAAVTDAALARRWQAAIAGFGGSGAETPLAPLARAAVRATAAAARNFSAASALTFDSDARGYRLALSRTDITARNGARVTLNRGAGVEVDSTTGLRLNGLLAITGGGLPEAAIRLAQRSPGGAVTGTGLVRPYAAGGARIALDAVDFTATPGGATRLSTRVALSGPLGDGRIDNAVLPIEAYWDGGRRLRVNPDCAPLAFYRLALAGLVLDRARLGLCPIGGALLTIDGGRVTGGVAVASPDLAGRLGNAPVTLAAAEVRYATAAGLAARDIRVRLGEADHVSRLDVATLSGNLVAGGIDGRFAGGAGQLAKVPLLLSAASGGWRLVDSRLAIEGGLTVADADAAPRFNPLAARDVLLSLVDNRIAATGVLVEPAQGVKISDVTIAHDLGTGLGRADLVVPGIAFNEGFQPDRLTRFTYGIIADVVGRVSGDGHIRWDRDGVTSDGVFRTVNTDLAAAFGPVTGLSGEIRFTDLLALESAPGQVATVAVINPGVPVREGVFRYQALAGERIAVESARWPFAGGELTLEPATLDFGEGGERQLTFRVAGVDAGQFLQQFDFKNLDATGTFDGVLPMRFDQHGGRIDDGRLKVREAGGGTIAYVGEISQKDVGFWGNIAFQALKSLRYRNLDIMMNGPLDGEMITEVRFAGVSQGSGAKSNFLVRRLQRLPLIFNVRIQAPFRQLIDSAQSYYDPRRLIERNLPALIKAQDDALKAKASQSTPVQPPESEPMP